MKPFLRNLTLGFLAALLAALATVALPLLHYALSPKGKKPALRIVAQVHLVSLEPPRPEMKPEHAIHEPVRAPPNPMMLQSGPRFAMDLGVMGGGVAVPAGFHQPQKRQRRLRGGKRRGRG